MTTDTRRAARVAAPVAFLLAVTIAVLVVRGALREDGGTPSSSVPAAPGTGPATVVVRTGDTLDAIARRTGTTVEAIRRLNPGLEPTALRVGRRIRVRPG